ncbi:MAG TPA: SPOR domain-containing protein [Steroidobacteraceae bacterium]|nr:SPOR domain-containing protein [Steroidobacteraceae bacterium]
MAKLTARDYKKTHRRGLELRRLGEFGYGTLFGVALALLAYAYFGAAHRRAAEAAAAPRPDPHRAAPLDPGAGEGSAARTAEKYDFYEMLPHFEVVVPEKDKEVRRDLPPGAPIERPGVYVLQAGSYRNEADAERVRRQLALQGVQAKVQRVAVDSDVWHRVRIGPITRLDELNRVRKQLRAADVDALVIRVGD